MSLTARARRHRLRDWLVGFGVAACIGATLAGITDFSPGLLQYIAQKWGGDARTRVVAWHQFVVAHAVAQHDAATDMRLIQETNEFWNAVPYQEDADTWGDADYWATPVETLGVDYADCKNYAFGKYFTLKALGVPVRQMRITYVMVRDGNLPHMVLAYYPTPDADPFILDNLNPRVLPASQRDDLDPVYSFNDDDLWTAGSAAHVGKSSQIRLWSQLLQKMADEQKR
jgi:predicted transglutaminase-like cysteine proteinase